MDILLERKSVRKYTSQDVKKEDLEYILRAGLCAPTARNSRCVSFLVIKDKKTHKKLAAVHQAAQMILQSPLAVLVVGDKNLVYQEYLPQDCAAATENLLLAATAKDYGSVWCGVYSNKERSEAIEKILNLPENMKAFSLVVIGKSNDNGLPKDKWDPAKIKYEVWE
jgi:nitroreductase